MPTLSRHALRLSQEERTDLAPAEAEALRG